MRNASLLWGLPPQVLLVSAICLPPPAAALLQSKTENRLDVLTRLQHYSFDDFVKQFGRSYVPGTEEWERRERVFNRRLQEVIDFHNGPPRTWSMGITKFMDFTDSEFNAVLGYRGRRATTAPSLLSVERQKAFRGRRAGSSLLSMEQAKNTRQEPLPKAVNTLREGSRLARIIRDQGGCGSCWAEAATSVLEARMESNQTMTGVLAAQMKAMKKAPIPTLSSQTVVSCSPNPRHCGGSGACGGATAELAYEMIKERGLPLAITWPYKSASGTAPACDDSVFSKVVIGIQGYVVLPSNKVEPLKRALIETGGPIAITAAASQWAYYDHGIFSDVSHGTTGDFTVNHAVTLVGYKDPEPNEMGYWVVKNSWGESWGENGYIRIEMKENEEQHCGWDYNPKEGIACDGDPDKAWVCGTCGILYDSTYPTGVHMRNYMYADTQ